MEERERLIVPIDGDVRVMKTKKGSLDLAARSSLVDLIRAILIARKREKT